MSVPCVIRVAFLRKASNLSQQGALAIKPFQMCDTIQMRTGFVLLKKANVYKLKMRPLI